MLSGFYFPLIENGLSIHLLSAVYYVNSLFQESGFFKDEIIMHYFNATCTYLMLTCSQQWTVSVITIISKPPTVNDTKYITQNFVIVTTYNHTIHQQVTNQIH